MKLIIVRHADPDYEHDFLTEVGLKEASLLVPRMLKLNEDLGGFTDIYCSPLGRAKATAKPTLDFLGREAIEKEWLREFEGYITRPDTPDRQNCCWDWLPEDWTKIPEHYDINKWNTTETMSPVKKEYDWVCEEFDKVLAEHGYVRADDSEGCFYHAENSNHDTLVFFCHFGLEGVLLSHLTNCSPMIYWHNFCAAPSSVTIVNSEERRKGIASFRIATFGDTSHLFTGKREPSFAARFCECYDDDTRHD